MLYVVSKSVSGAYRQLLEQFRLMRQDVSPRGLPVREALNAVVEVTEPTEGSITTSSPKRDERMARYLEAEFDLYERGEDRVEEYAKHAKFWRDVTDGDRINSAYGRIVFFAKSMGRKIVCHRCLGSSMSDLCPECRGDGEVGQCTPWEWAKRKLVQDPDTRQAMVQYLRPDHYQEPTKDFVCTTHGIFHLRGGRLNYTVTMRSNDVVRGFAYDVPWQVRCQYRMARELEVEVGTYTHIVHSLHLYERDAALVEEMLGVNR